MTTSNVLLVPWSGPFGGLPPFDRVNVADFAPALEAAMADNLAEVDRIARDTTPPTFDNAIAALERAGRMLDRVTAIFGVWASNVTTPAFQTVQREMAPKLAAMSDRITQNEALFRRIEEVYASPSRQLLPAEQQRLTWRYYTNFVRAGARLGATAKERLSAINQRLAVLFTEFNQHVLADETSYTLGLESEADLAGLPPSVREAAAAEAETRHYAGTWVITNTRSAMEPFLTYASRRDLRERGWRMWIERGDNGDEHDTNVIITEKLPTAKTRERRRCAMSCS